MGDTDIEILFIRHSQSCANLAKDKNKKIVQISYTDPELTRRGKLMAREAGAQLAAKLTAIGWPIADVRFGSSTLLRAQQTLREIIDANNVTSNIYMFPHIAEEGLTSDNHPFPVERQQTYLSSYRTRELTNLSNVKGAVSDAKTFFKWVGSQLTADGDFIEAGVKKLFIVTHSHFMSSMSKMLGAKKSFNNLDGIRVTFTYGPDKTLKNTVIMPDWTYEPSAAIPADGCDKSECRKDNLICIKTFQYSTHRNFITNERITSDIMDLTYDTHQEINPTNAIHPYLQTSDTNGAGNYGPFGKLEVNGGNKKEIEFLENIGLAFRKDDDAYILYRAAVLYRDGGIFRTYDANATNDEKKAVLTPLLSLLKLYVLPGRKKALELATKLSTGIHLGKHVQEELSEINQMMQDL